VKLLKIAVVLVLVVGAAVSGFLWIRSRRNGDGLRFATVRRGNLAVKVSDVGTIEPRLKVEVKSKVAGRIIDVLVDEGDWVEKGQTIALVDRTELERNLEQTLADLEASQARLVQARLRVESARSRFGTQVAQAKARLDAARANLANLRAGPRRQEVARAEAEVESARIALRDAQNTLEQRLFLLKQGVLRRRQAESEVKATKAALAQLKAGARTEEVRSAEAAVQRAEATGADAESELKRQQQLLQKGFVPQQRVDTAQTQGKVAAADLKRAREQLALLKAGSRQEEIDAAQARLDRAEAELAAVQATNEQEIASLKAKVDLATADVGRAEESLSLLKEGSRAEQIEGAEAQLREAEAALTAAKDGQTEIGLAKEDVTQAQAASRRLEQTRDNVQTQLADTVIQAPMAGTVIDRAIDPGELTTSGVSAFGQGQPIVTIADLSEMRVEARVNEVDIARLKVGQTAEVKVDALPDKKLKGVIRQISPSAGPLSPQNSGITTFEVLIVIPDPDPALKTGMSADVDVQVAKARNVLTVSLDAVWQKGGKWTGRLVANPAEVKAWEKAKREGKAPTVKTKDVTLQCGLRNEMGIEIKKGLKNGDLLRTDNIGGKEQRRKFERPK
jgi:HlyD family secretion protein